MNKLFDEEIECCLLGGLILESKHFPLLSIDDDFFVVGPNERIFVTMRDLYAENQKFNRASIIASLGGKSINLQNNSEISMQDYVTSLIESVISTSFDTLSGYVDALRSLATKRRVVETISRINSHIADMSSDEINADLSNLILRNSKADDILSESQVREKIIDAMSRPANCYPTGLDDLDIAMSGGLFAGYTYGICGSEKSGKTTFAHTISHNLASSGHKHLYVALEMGSVQIEQRNIARGIGVNSMRFIDRPDQIASKVMSTPITGCKFFYDAPGATVHDILSKAKAAQLKYGITGFIVDYWQLIEGQGQRDSEERHLRFVAQTLANFSRKSGLWCLILAQLNKDGQLFGGNGLRKACDQLFFIEQPEALSCESMRWLRMDASRYTPRNDIGNDVHYPFEVSKAVGPFIINTNKFFR